jgi:hypothetical protein
MNQNYKTKNMKIIISLLFLNLIFTAVGKDLKAYSASFQIVSNAKSTKIPKGQYIIEATVYEIQSNQKLSSLVIKSVSKKVITDSKGWFKMKVKISENYLQIDRKGYPTYYIENYLIQDQHHIKMKIFISRIPEVYGDGIDVAEKPVIYCYSEKPIHFDLKLSTVGELAFAYPMMNANQSWSMDLENNELIDSKSKQKYPYLFWESEQEGVDFMRQNGNKAQNEINASIVSKLKVVSFLDSTLTTLGFNSKEKTDFITYWGPRMQNANFYMIQFLQDNECEQIASYKINPKPDHLNRFYMLFMENETNDFQLEVLPQNLKPLERNGFYMVDWGGIQLGNLNKSVN